MENANNKTEELIKLIKENPELPVVPMVNYELALCIEDYGYWVGSFGSAQVEEFACVEMYGNNKVIYKQDQGYIEEYFAEKILDENEDLSDEEIEKLAHERAEALPWKKAIIVYIELP